MVSRQKTSVICNRQNTPECDRCILNLLRFHPILADENTSKFNKERQILTQLKQVFDQLGLLLVAIDGRVQFMTQQANHLLRQYALTHNPKALPEPLQHWFAYQISRFTSDIPSPCLSLNIEQAGRQLVVRLIPDPIGEQYLLLLEEQELPFFSIAALELLGLTKREAEVLFWIARDKSNVGIAGVLGCCEGTVRKHLEHLYKKLGVQTRTGAMMVSLEKLGLLKGSFVAISS
jgi:DNA-binding CsgD family transcriptional regulator